MNNTITRETLTEYRAYLIAQERSNATIEKYLHDAGEFALWLGERALSRELAGAWKAKKLDEGYKPQTINAALSALNNLFRFLDRADCQVRFLKVQRRIFRDETRELTQAEYKNLVRTAQRQGRERLALMLETIGGTGIRVSELSFITVSAARTGRADVALKGKIRTILLPDRLCKKLLRYAGEQGITCGEIFRTKRGTGVSRQQIWSEMKALCAAAGVEPDKVFPHNLRHLFARVFYRVCQDIVKLADVLGHSSLETTRIYLMTTTKEHRQQLDRLLLVL